MEFYLSAMEKNNWRMENILSDDSLKEWTGYRKRCLKRKAGIMYRVVYGMRFMFFVVYTYSAVKKWRDKI